MSSQASSICWYFMWQANLSWHHNMLRSSKFRQNYRKIHCHRCIWTCGAERTTSKQAMLRARNEIPLLTILTITTIARYPMTLSKVIMEWIWNLRWSRSALGCVIESRVFHVFFIDHGQVLQNAKAQKGLARGLYQVCQVLTEAWSRWTPCVVNCLDFFQSINRDEVQLVLVAKDCDEGKSSQPWNRHRIPPSLTSLPVGSQLRGRPQGSMR